MLLLLINSDNNVGACSIYVYYVAFLLMIKINISVLEKTFQITRFKILLVIKRITCVKFTRFTASLYSINVHRIHSIYT